MMERNSLQTTATLYLPVYVRNLYGAVVLACMMTLVVVRAQQPPTPNLLMIGNSYTRNNAMATMVDNLLDEGLNTSAFTSSFAIPGSTLKQHSERQELSNRITERSWTWVVLQEQSQIPGFWVFPNGNLFQNSLEAAIALHDTITDNGAETIFLMTWGRRMGDSHNPNTYPNFITMQALLAEGYYRYQDATNTTQSSPVKIAPVGLAFEFIYELLVADSVDPTEDGTAFSNLYSNDGSHPSNQGSYLAACVVYATLTNHDPRGLQSAPSGFTTELRDFLQSVAYETLIKFGQDFGHDLTPSPSSSLILSLEPSSSIPSSIMPSLTPSTMPVTPSLTPSSVFSTTPSLRSSSEPSSVPSLMPSSMSPSWEPSFTPSLIPSNAPSTSPSTLPSQDPLTVEFIVQIHFDLYPYETGWNLMDITDNILIWNVVPGTYPTPDYDSTTIAEVIMVNRGKSYRFTIIDDYGDGLCCGYGEGYYELSAGEVFLGYGSVFGAEQSIDFTVS